MPTVLVVDDNPMALELVREVLEPEGFDVLLCQDPREALSLAAKADVMILDVMMPEVSGFELLEELRGNPELKGIPVLMLSALDEGDDRADGLEVGADDYLGKPFHSRELLLRVQKLLAPRRRPGIILEGELGRFAVGNVLQQILSSQQTGVLEVAGESFLSVRVEKGLIMGASFGKLQDREALIAAISIREGHFVFHQSQGEEVAERAANISVAGVMMEAAWLHDEFEKRRSHLPEAGRALKFCRADRRVVLPGELAQLEIQDVADWLAANVGGNLARLEAEVPLAPPKLRLALAWLVEEGFVSVGESQEPDA